MKPKPKQKNCSHSINSSIILIILIISLMLSFYHQLFLISIEVNSSSKSKDFSKPEDSWQYFNNIVRPNADISNSGFTTVPSGASIYSVLDDIVNYPDSGGDSDYLIGDSITDTCELDMSSISLGS